jgi:hypothetical protein
MSKKETKNPEKMKRTRISTKTNSKNIDPLSIKSNNNQK